MISLIDQFLNTNPKGGAQANPVSELLRQCRRSFVLAAFLTLIVEVVSLTPIVFIWNVHDRVATARSTVTLYSLIFLVILLYIFWSGIDWIRDRLMIRIALRMDWEIADRVFDASFRRFVATRDIDVHQIMGDVVRLRWFITSSTFLSLMAAPYAVVFILMAWAFHPYLALFIAIAVVVHLLSTYHNSRVSGPVQREAGKASALAKRTASQLLSQSEIAMALGMHGTMRDRWYKTHRHFLGLQINSSETSGFVGSVTNFISRVLPSLQIALAGLLVIEGAITGGMMMAGLLLMRRAIDPIKRVMSAWSSVQSVRESLERLNDLVAEDELWEARMPLPRPRGSLDVHQLTWAPNPKRRPVIDGVTFQLQPGQVLAVVGPSASGKSSLLKLLIGILNPSSGEVRLDDADIAPWIRAELGEHVGYVPQEIRLFPGTVAENIARMNAIDPDRIVKAAEAVGLHSDILRLPDGYQTVVRENGAPLTGGQRQKLVIARAVYNDPVYLVMDEPNASLDKAGDEALLETIRHLKAAGVTVVFSTHRMNLTEVADFCLALRDGKQIDFAAVDKVLNNPDVVVLPEPPVLDAIALKRLLPAKRKLRRKTKVRSRKIKKPVAKVAAKPSPLAAPETPRIQAVGGER